MRIVIISFLSGILFAAGLVVSGMTLPTKVTGFLDVTGAWDPSLMFVMMGGIAANAVLFRIARRRGSPLVGNFFRVSPKTMIDAKLIAGSVLFGMGWGLGGVCPGPALVAVASGAVPMLVFTGAMIAGFFIYSRIDEDQFDC
jgi:uncharacterized membrane protein YedE/YeeE